MNLVIPKPTNNHKNHKGVCNYKAERRENGIIKSNEPPGHQGQVAVRGSQQTPCPPGDTWQPGLWKPFLPNQVVPPGTRASHIAPDKTKQTKGTWKGL